MPPITAKVTWPAGASQPIVSPDPIVVPQGSGATVIHWTCGDGVSSLEISGLDSTVFTPSASNGMVNSFSTTDANRTPQTYDYNVGATRTGGGSTQFDPRIQNGG